MPPTTPTIGQQCAILLKAAKQKATAAGEVMSWGEVASIIDRVCPAPKGKRPAKSAAAMFGDRTKIPPTPAQVALYSASIGYPIDGEAFCDFYASKGWFIGKNKMKDWQAAVRTWKSKGRGDGWKPAAAAPKDYSRI